MTWTVLRPSFDACDCPCHQSAAIVHIVPCCDRPGAQPARQPAPRESATPDPPEVPVPIVPGSR